MTRTRLLRTAAAALVALTIGIESPTARASTAPARAQRNVIADFAYHPPTQVVPRGAAITVINLDGTVAGIPHSLTADNGSFDTGTFKGGSRTIHAPARPGRYPFHCNVHFFMHGVLVVAPVGG